MAPTAGGVTATIRASTDEMVRQGHAVTIVSLDDPGEPWLASMSDVVALGRPAFLGSYRLAPALSGWLKEYATEFNVAVIEGLWQFHSLAASRILHSIGVPYFVFPHGMLDEWFKTHYRLKHLKKVIYWNLWERKVLSRAKAVIFTAEAERDSAIRAFGTFASTTEVVALGIPRPETPIEAARANFFREHPHLEGKHLVLFLGRFHEKKGVDLLVDAFARVSHISAELVLVMAGSENEYVEEIRSQIQSLGISDRVVWLGHLQGDKKRGVLAAADAFALFSHQENFGMAVVEALEAGLPVLISNRIDIWQEVQSSGAGLIGEDTRAGAFEVLSRWLQLSDETRLAMRKNATRLFGDAFEVGASVERLLSVLNKPIEHVTDS